MIIRMAKVEIVGPKEELMPVLDMLRGRGVFQPDPQLIEARPLAQEDRPRALVLDEHDLHEKTFFEDLRGRIRALLELLPELAERERSLPMLPVMDVINEMVDRHLDEVRKLDADLAGCREEAEMLEREMLFWQTLEPLTRELPDESGLEMFGVTIRDPNQLDALTELLHERTGGRCHITSTEMDDGTLVGLIATDRTMAKELREALSEEHVPELTLPAELSGLPLSERAPAIRQRLLGCRSRCEALQHELADLAREWRPIYQNALAWLDERLSLYLASSAAYATRQCFVVQGWMAADDVPPLRDSLADTFAGRVVVEQQKILEEDLDRVPVLLRNPTYFKPFELFARLLPLPKYTSYDPTPFIGLFFPVLFGMILGDVGYGLVLAALAAYLALRCPDGCLASDLGKVLGVAAAYTIIFGLLFGELFGDLGERWLGLHPLWIDRGRAVVPMIAFAITVGVMHVLFGLGLGAWSDLRRHQRREALVKLVILATVLLLVLALVGWLYPASTLATGPLLTGVAILMPVLIFAGGLLAPLELLKTLGNIISYVRIMAIGLCSVLLAVVANQLGGMTGDVLLGILVAGLLHAFNLLLGLFAPTVHSLRLHYVEFFSKFLDLGGRRFEPWHKKPS